MVKYLSKANDDVLSHCACTDTLAAGPAQLDCPWCGCGWLTTCIKCRRAFTFARVVDVDRTYADIVREDFAARGDTALDEEVGDIVVYLDGSYLPLDTENFAYDGWFAQHDFDRLPHALALEQPNALRDTLGDKQYWVDRELEDQD